MSKNFEKKPEKKLEKEQKELDKIKDKAELEKRKELKQEIKETKEIYKDKLEQNEWTTSKTISSEKQTIFEIPSTSVFRAEKPEEGAQAPKLEDLKQREIQKIKPEKEFPDKFQKEIEKVKPEKEFEKFQKEIEKIKPEKEFPEKFQVKPEFEKPSAETRLDPGTRLFKGVGNPEDRLRELEDAVEKLMHFIGVDLRPDLTTGALKGEPDVAGGEAKPDDKKKPK